MFCLAIYDSWMNNMLAVHGMVNEQLQKNITARQ